MPRSVRFQIKVRASRTAGSSVGRLGRTARTASTDREARGTWQILATIWHVLLWPKVPLIALIAVAMSGGAS